MTHTASLSAASSLAGRLEGRGQGMLLSMEFCAWMAWDTPMLFFRLSLVVAWFFAGFFFLSEVVFPEIVAEYIGG